MKTAAPPILAALLFAGLFSATVTPHTRVSTQLSWNGDVQRILAARCTRCHQDNQPSTVPDFSQYAKARPWARAIREAILDGHGFSASNGAALTPFERELLVQWIDGGAPEKPKSYPVEFSRLPAGYTRIASPDPVTTLEEHRAIQGGVRTIIPGLGLSLRSADRITVFDRGGDTERLIARGTIVPSLAAYLASLPASTPRSRLSDAAYIVGPAAEPRAEAAEIAPDGPDRFWCSMHPEVRSPIAGTCPRCAMKLVEIPAMSLDTFGMEVVSAVPAQHGVRVTLQVKRGWRGTPVTSLLTVHERPFHLFLIDDKLETFQHVHPELDGETLNATIYPHGNRQYWLVGDFPPVDAFPQLRMTHLPKHADTVIADRPPFIVHAKLSAGDLRAGRESRLTFEVSDPATGLPPADMEPYLGAAGHLFAIDEALQNPMHAHPIDVADGGMARPAFDVRFPRAGRYVMWLQVQRAGRVETMRFTADVSK